MTQVWRLWHRWIGAFAAVILLSSAVTGWLMLHETWLQGRDLTAIAADPQVPNHLLSAGPQGFWRSTDGGISWADVTMPVPTEHVSALVAGPTGFAVALRDFGVWRSSDGYIWDRVAEAPDSEWIRGLSFRGSELVYLTDAALVVGGQRHTQSRSWQHRIHDWHTGWAFGRPGTLTVETGAISLVLLTVSGLVLFVRSRSRRHRHRRRTPSHTPDGPTVEMAPSVP